MVVEGEARGRRRNLSDELQQEMEAHLQFLIDENLERGIPLEEARAAARRNSAMRPPCASEATNRGNFPRLNHWPRIFVMRCAGWCERPFSRLW